MELGIILETKRRRKTWNVCRLAITVKKENEVNIFLMSKAVEYKGLYDAKFNVVNR